MHHDVRTTLNQRLALTALVLAMLALPSLASANPLFTNVWTTAGWIKGAETDYGYEFLGVPYAAAPERWEPPLPPQRWWGRRDATELPPACPQPGTSFGVASEEEDCLFLNVYRPRNLLPTAPVMVWIHGGSYKYGFSGSTEPRKLVEQGMVVVTINYRLGALGFMAHPELSAESADGTSGNYGLMDQQAALEWVRRNIWRFGGNPNNVTIFGESAGGHSVLAHLTSPASAGLFDRAIVQSGAYTLEQPSQTDWEQAGLAVQASAGCADLQCLRDLPVADLLTAQDAAGDVYFTVVDGALLPLPFAAAIATGQFNQVPVINGSTRDEFSLFVALFNDLVGQPVTEANYVDALAATLGVPVELAAFVATVYPVDAYDQPALGVTAAGTDAAFACTGLGLTDLLAQHVSTYGYEFDDPDAPQLYLPPVSFPYGAYHTSEIQYLMDATPVFPAAPFTAEQEALSDLMVTYWAQFADAGDPNAAGAPEWTPYDPPSGLLSLQSLKPETTGPMSVLEFAGNHKCDFWSSL